MKFTRGSAPTVFLHVTIMMVMLLRTTRARDCGFSPARQPHNPHMILGYNRRGGPDGCFAMYICLYFSIHWEWIIQSWDMAKFRRNVSPSPGENNENRWNEPAEAGLFHLFSKLSRLASSVRTDIQDFDHQRFHNLHQLILGNPVHFDGDQPVGARIAFEGAQGQDRAPFLVDGLG